MYERPQRACERRSACHPSLHYLPIDGACCLGVATADASRCTRWAESGPNETACSALREKVYPRRMTMRRGPECADMHVRFGCVSVRRSHANAALHVLSSRHPIKPVHTCSNARVSCLVGYGNRKHESQARCVCAALLSPCLCVQTHLGCNASRSMRCDKSDLQLVRLLANASQRTPFLKTRLIGTQRKMP